MAFKKPDYSSLFGKFGKSKKEEEPEIRYKRIVIPPAKRPPVLVQVGDITSLLKRKKKRGRGATMMGSGTKRPGLLSLLSNSRKTLLGQ